MRLWNQWRRRLGHAVRAACVVVLIASGGAALAGDALPGLSDEEFARLHQELEMKGGMWELDWKISVTEARKQAAKERKPIFMVVNTGNCLGYV
ncbi:MAG: hypothetical protein WD066_19440 [Planctomycetaceae bacterium]